jgi:hypothetical protein
VRNSGKEEERKRETENERQRQCQSKFNVKTREAKKKLTGKGM